MIEHMVWIKFRDGVSEERVGEHMAALAGLADNVPGIVDLKIGENFCDHSGGYTHGLLIQFESRQNLDAYVAHPNHVAVAQPLFEDADVLAMDIEC